MAYIRMVPDDSAHSEVKEIYDRYRAPWGGVDNILRVHGLLPDTLAPHYEMYRNIMFGRGPLTRRQREMLAIVVSKANACSYCIHHHSDALLRVTKDRTLVHQVRNDFRTANILNEEKVLLDFADELTRNPSDSYQPWIQRLKELGFSEEAILHATLITGYFNYVNRIANGLGVELEPYWMPDGYSDPGRPMSHDDRGVT